MIINPFIFSSGPPGATTTLNPSDKSSNITLSGGDLTAEHNSTSSFSLCRATTSKSSGKWYFEGTSGGTGPGGGAGVFGLCSSTTALTDWVSRTDGVGYYNTGVVNRSGTDIASGLSTWSSGGQNLQCAVDLDNDRIWFRKSGDNWNNSGTANPATNTGGLIISTLSSTLYPAISLYSNTVPDKITVNFGATTFTGSIPSGFSAWG